MQLAAPAPHLRHHVLAGISVQQLLLKLQTGKIKRLDIGYFLAARKMTHFFAVFVRQHHLVKHTIGNLPKCPHFVR